MEATNIAEEMEGQLFSARQNRRDARRSDLRLTKGCPRQDAGMKEPVGRFYHGIEHRCAPAIPHREMILTACIMEPISTQAYLAKEQ
jgi:hypothetical protein